MEGRDHRQRRRQDEDKTEELIKVAKTPAEIQRLRLEKLIKNFDKPAPIPNPKKEYQPPPPPEFVRNVVGSSAGAGSGEYHIYRNLRKREYARRQFNEEQEKKEKLDQEFFDKMEKNKLEAEEKTAKRRAKRQKKKVKSKTKNAKASELDDASEKSDQSDDNGGHIEHSDVKLSDKTNENNDIVS